MPDGPDMDVFLELGRELLLVLANNINVKTGIYLIFFSPKTTIDLDIKRTEAKT